MEFARARHHAEVARCRSGRRRSELPRAERRAGRTRCAAVQGARRVREGRAADAGRAGEALISRLPAEGVLRPGPARAPGLFWMRRAFIDNGGVNRHPHSTEFHCCASLACALIACAGAAHAQDAPSVTPYRPSVSTPAALSAPGWLEVEAGVQSSRAVDPTRRETLPYTLKLAFTPDWGIRVGGDAIVRQRNADGTADHGLGDTSLVLKRRFAVNDASAFGLEL